MTQDDDDWFEALAGRSTRVASPATALEARLLRAAQQQAAQRLQRAALPGPDEQALLRAAREAGLLAPGITRCAGCAARWQVLRGWLQRPWGWGLAVAAVLGSALLVMQTSEQGGRSPLSDPSTVLRGSLFDGVWHVVQEQPREARDRLVGELETLGAGVRTYERLGRFGLDAEWPQGLPAAAAARLRTLGLAPDAAGLLRVEFESAP